MSIASPSTFTMTQFVRLPMRAESARDLQYLRHIKYVGGTWRLVSKPPMVRTRRERNFCNKIVSRSLRTSTPLQQIFTPYHQQLPPATRSPRANPFSPSAFPRQLLASI